jgi:thiamine pyrophosphokinase
MHWVIVANGSMADAARFTAVFAGADAVVGVDGGAEHCLRLNVVPDYVVGDLDSISSPARATLERAGAVFRKFPVRKDFTDTELAVELAWTKGATRITFLAVTGTRLDHTLGNINLLHRTLELGLAARILDDRHEIHLVDRILSLSGNPGDLLSVLPVSAQVHGITLRGLEYPLEEASLARGSTTGISNVFQENRVEVRVGKGVVLVIRTREEDP